MIDFDAINESLNIIQVASWLGLQPDGRGSCLCPFHDDSNLGNFKISESRRLFKCFACGESGNSIVLTAKMKGISNGEAAQLLNDVFRLGFAINRPKTRNEYTAERVRLRRMRQKRDFELWCGLMYNALCGQYRRRTDAVRALLPADVGELLSPYISAVNKLNLLEVLLDVLQRADPDECRIYKQLIEEASRQNAG